MNIALLTAGGTATRMGQNIPKQFLHVYDKPILIYTLEAFQKHPSIDAIIVSGLENWIEVIWAYANQFNISKLKWVVKGGATGQQSICNALIELEKHCSGNDIVLVHDGNRPMVSNEIITDSLLVCKQYGSAVAGIPCTEVVYRKNETAELINIPREELVRTQTPHTYPLSKLLWAHQEAARLELNNTAASCDLMHRLGEKIYFSRGEEKNLKITTLEDMEIFKSLLNTEKCEWLK